MTGRSMRIGSASASERSSIVEPAGLELDRGAAIDRHREHESAGVVGVVADQVHPSRCVHASRRCHRRQRSEHAPFVVAPNRSATLGSMPRAGLPSGIELEYVTTGDPADPPLLVVNGYTSQLISWPSGYIEQLVAQGLFVIQFDNRDVGLSTQARRPAACRPAPCFDRVIAGEPIPPVPYTLSDMAADGIGLLDHLGIERAHIVGNSMGGMIVQTMAIEHPDRIASVTSVMSSPGDPRVGRPTPEARDALLAPPPPVATSTSLPR